MDSTLRVLNVDDDDAARYIKRRLLAQAGHVVIDADSASAALRAVAVHAPQLALVDVKLPDMTGFELTRRLKLVAALPVIQISAVCITRDDRRDGLESGADAYLTSPVEYEDLVSAIQQVQRREPAAVPPPPRSSADRVAMVREFVTHNLERRLPISRLARIANWSPFHFARTFHEVSGETPHAFVKRLRLEKAQELLADTDLPLAEIARRVGFGSASHFASVFRVHAGMSPSEFRVARKTRVQ
jgi:AraC-like DNA-binding protein/CheY-like chemotaxis protein